MNRAMTLFLMNATMMFPHQELAFFMKCSGELHLTYTNLKPYR